MAKPREKSEAHRAYMKAWREKNRDHIKAYSATWRAENAEKVSSYNVSYMKDWAARPENQHRTWVRNLRRNYRMSPEQFNTLWARQEGKCAICQVSLLPKGRDKDAVAVDHNHETGEVRGLLCRACNHGIGCLKDNPDVLKCAAEYLLERGHYAHNLKGMLP